MCVCCYVCPTHRYVMLVCVLAQFSGQLVFLVLAATLQPTNHCLSLLCMQTGASFTAWLRTLLRQVREVTLGLDISSTAVGNTLILCYRGSKFNSQPNKPFQQQPRLFTVLSLGLSRLFPAILAPPWEKSPESCTLNSAKNLEP